MNLKMDLSLLLPKAIVWAEAQQANILATGVCLTEDQILIAREVGVARPENIRIKLVNQIPIPEDPELAAAAIQTGLIGPQISGMALFYGIFLCENAQGYPELIAHECRHVQQYEQKGSIAAFLAEYLAG